MNDILSMTNALDMFLRFSIPQDYAQFIKKLIFYKYF